MKRLLIALLVLPTLSAFADEQKMPQRPNPEVITLTGVIESSQNCMPSITVDGQKYFLSPFVKGRAAEGETVTLKGFVKPKPDFQPPKDGPKKDQQKGKSKGKEFAPKKGECQCQCHCPCGKQNPKMAFDKKGFCPQMAKGKPEMAKDKLEFKKPAPLTEEQIKELKETPFFVVKEMEVGGKTFVFVPAHFMHK